MAVELSPEMEQYRANLRKQMNDYADDVATGGCADFPEYKRLCGVIQGLALAERTLLDLAERMAKADDNG